MRHERAKEEPDDSKSPHERFKELGERLMSVPKPEIDEQERKWHRAKRRKQPKTTKPY